MLWQKSCESKTVAEMVLRQFHGRNVVTEMLLQKCCDGNAVEEIL